MLYDVAPTVGPPDPCSAPKQRKLDSCSVSPNSILGCMMNQDQSLYHNNNNTVDDLAFKDTHATLSVPGDVWADAALKNMMGSLMKPEATVQDMMDTLQQILGENELADTLDVEPDELKSWESTLLKLSTSCDASDDLCDVLSSDILTYVEEQLQREGVFQMADQLDEIPPCVDLQSQTHQNFSWAGEPQKQLLPSRGQQVSQLGAPVCGTVKLTHIDLPQSSAGLDGPALQLINFQPSSGRHLESCSQGQPGVEDSSLGPFSLRRPPANQDHCHQVTQPIQNHLASVQENPVFTFQGNHWSSTSAQVDHFLDSYSDHVSSQRAFVANPPVSGCLQGHLGHQNSDRQKQSWSLDQQQLHQHTSAGPQHEGACLNQRNPLQKAVNGRSLLRSSETSSVPYAAQHSGTSSTCMFANVGPSTPSCSRLNPTGQQIPSQYSCLYGGAPGGGAVPGMTSVLNPDEMALTCKTSMALGPEDLRVQPQLYLNVSDNHIQVRAEKTPIQSSRPQFPTAEYDKMFICLLLV